MSNSPESEVSMEGGVCAATGSAAAAAAAAIATNSLEFRITAEVASFKF